MCGGIPGPGMFVYKHCEGVCVCVHYTIYITAGQLIVVIVMLLEPGNLIAYYALHPLSLYIFLFI